MDLPYTGHTLRTEDGDVIHHVVKRSRIVVTIDISVGTYEEKRFDVTLTVDEARRLATSLLRDICLIEDGVG